MDVSEKKATVTGIASEHIEQGGTELIETLVSLTELPGSWVKQELNGILESTGQVKEDLTLEGLRAAMIAYLESIQDEMDQGEMGDDWSSDEDSPEEEDSTE